MQAEEALIYKNEYVETKNGNLRVGIAALEGEISKLKEEKNEMLNKLSQTSEIIKSLKEENKELKNKGIKLQQCYNDALNRYREQCLKEISKVRTESRDQQIMEVLRNNNRNLSDEARELRISR